VDVQPIMANSFTETYGVGSRCLEHGRQWSRTYTAQLWGAGCYQVWKL